MGRSVRRSRVRESRRGYSPDGRRIWDGEQWVPLRGGLLSGRGGRRAGGAVPHVAAVAVVLLSALGWVLGDSRHHEGEVDQLRRSAHCASFNLGDPCR